MVNEADFLQEPPRLFYGNQCRVLEEQLSIAENILNKEASPDDVSSADPFWPQSALTELRRVTKLRKTLIKGCYGEPCHKSYLRLGERTEAFVEILKAIIWCFSVVFYYNTMRRFSPLNSSLATNKFPREFAAVPCRVGNEEQFLLQKAALANQKELEASIDIWIQNPGCNAKECGRPLGQHDDPLICLAD